MRIIVYMILVFKKEVVYTGLDPPNNTFKGLIHCFDIILVPLKKKEWKTESRNYWANAWILSPFCVVLTVRLWTHNIGQNICIQKTLYSDATQILARNRIHACLLKAIPNCSSNLSESCRLLDLKGPETFMLVWSNQFWKIQFGLPNNLCSGLI